MERLQLKDALRKKCILMVSQTLDRLDYEMRELQASAENETKSSVGDKYETGRAMVMLEKEKLATQRLAASKQLQYLNSLVLKDIQNEVGPGSVVMTEGRSYFIGVGLGEVFVDGSIYISVSPASPVAKVMMDKKKGDSFQVMGEVQTITEVF